MYRTGDLGIQLSPTVITEEGCLWQNRVTKGTIRQNPESASFAEPGFGTIFRMAIGTRMIIHRFAETLGIYQILEVVAGKNRECLNSK